MNIMRKEISSLVILVGLVAVFSFLLVSTTYAAVTDISIQPSVVRVGATASYKINFTPATNASSTLIIFPSTFDISGATLTATSSITGNVYATSTAQAGVLLPAGGTTPFTAGAFSVTIGGIVNPSQAGSYTMTITTKTGTDGTGTDVDTGNATFVIQKAPTLADTTAPVSKITRPTAGATISAGQSYVIEGTGSDESTVAKVEVSLDDGKTWSIAKSISSPGTFRWEYVWQNPTEGEYTIRVRATDSAGNIESPAAGVKVTVPAALVPEVPPEEVPEVVPEKPITEMTVQELQTKVAELQQTLINLLQQLVQLLQQQLQGLLS